MLDRVRLGFCLLLLMNMFFFLRRLPSQHVYHLLDAPRSSMARINEKNNHVYGGFGMFVVVAVVVVVVGATLIVTVFFFRF
jgi:hypothetical protein